MVGYSGNMVYWLSCLKCRHTFAVYTSFDLDDAATYCHCPECITLIKLWGEDDCFILHEEEAFL